MFVHAYKYTNIVHRMGSSSRRKRKSTAKSAKNRWRKRKKTAEAPRTPKAKAKPVPTADLPAETQDWSRSDCLKYFKNEPTLHADLVAAGYKTKRSDAGYWYVQSPGKKNAPGRTFIAGSSRLKTKSIAQHLIAPAKVLTEADFAHVSAPVSSAHYAFVHLLYIYQTLDICASQNQARASCRHRNSARASCCFS